MNTLFLNPQTWDLTIDSNGNIAVTTNPYSLAQDAACAIKLFAGEFRYDTKLGLPYWTKILGQRPSIQLLKQLFVAAALTVPEIVSAKCFIKSNSNRGLVGQIQVMDINGVITASNLKI